jgi:hypothetical protein
MNEKTFTVDVEHVLLDLNAEELAIIAFAMIKHVYELQCQNEDGLLDTPIAKGDALQKKITNEVLRRARCYN